MRILQSLTYYRPNVSGLTIYVERLAAEMLRRGHGVTVLTAHHDQLTPEEEWVDGLRIVRVPVSGYVGKGPLMPMFPAESLELAQQHDIVHMHLPQFEAPVLAAAARYTRIPTLATYHCDLQLPGGCVDRMIDGAVHSSNVLTGALVDRMVAYTADYANHSRVLPRFVDKGVVIPPPVVMESPTPGAVDAFRQKYAPGNVPVVGFASRFAAEKGIDVAIQAMRLLHDEFPELTLLFAGPGRGVIGEESYWQRLQPEIEQLGHRWKFVGTLDSKELPAFYGSLDVLLMASVNSTESFGLVQVESMLCGTPVVATNLPGVRQPVIRTGMGEIVEIGDARALADGIARVMRNPEHYRHPREAIEQVFSLQRTGDAYEDLYRALIQTAEAA